MIVMLLAVTAFVIVFLLAQLLDTDYQQYDLFHDDWGDDCDDDWRE